MKKTAILATLAALALALPACSKNKKPAPVQPAADKPAPADDDKGDTKPAEDTADTADTAPASSSLGEVIYFEFDKSDLSDESRAVLDANADWLKEDAKRTLLIEGHTDEVGTTEYNLGLGDRRARAARDYLMRLGIADNRVTIITYGEERPASTEDAQNRRSVFVATKK
jgi:peptidoglycan-associated lipoprotein